MWQSWISFVFGIWLVISSLNTGLQGSFGIVIIGILVAALGFFFLKAWEGIVNGFLGIWLIICGFIPGFISTHNYLVVGILITVVSLIRVFHLHRGLETKHEIP